MVLLLSVQLSVVYTRVTDGGVFLYTPGLHTAAINRGRVGGIRLQQCKIVNLHTLANVVRRDAWNHVPVETVEIGLRTMLAH